MTVKRHTTEKDFQSLVDNLPRYKSIKAAVGDGIIKGKPFVLTDVKFGPDTVDLIVIMS